MSRYDDVPEGYPRLIPEDGDTWEERKNNYEKRTGLKVKPIPPIPEEYQKLLNVHCSACEENAKKFAEATTEPEPIEFKERKEK